MIDIEGSKTQLAVNEVQNLGNVFTLMEIVYENAYNSTLDEDIYKIQTLQYVGHTLDI